MRCLWQLLETQPRETFICVKGKRRLCEYHDKIEECPSFEEMTEETYEAIKLKE